MEPGGRHTFGLRLCDIQRPGRTTVKFAPAGTLIVENGHRVVSAHTVAPCPTAINHKKQIWLSSVTRALGGPDPGRYGASRGHRQDNLIPGASSRKARFL